MEATISPIISTQNQHQQSSPFPFRISRAQTTSNDFCLKDDELMNAVHALLLLKNGTQNIMQIVPNDPDGDKDRNKYKNKMKTKSFNVCILSDSENGNDPKNEWRPYPCTECSQSFLTTTAFTNHLRSHKKHKCAVCGDAFAYRSRLAVHQRSHRQSRFRCNLCGEMFSKQVSLRNHARIHVVHRYTSYDCDECDRRCSRTTALLIHQRKHSGEKPYECTFGECPKRFSTFQSAQEHRRTHTGEKAHKCKCCQKRFVRRSSLNAHIRKCWVNPKPNSFAWSHI